MDFTAPVASGALVAAALLLLTLLARRRRAPRAGPVRHEALDTVADWPPQAARVLTAAEREALDLLRRTLPGFTVLAQVPLMRFLRVPTQHPHAEWLRRVGSLSADLLVCDASTQVRAVIDLRTANETERSQRRHARLRRVLKAAGIAVQVWREGELPSASEVRDRFATLLEARPARQTPPRPQTQPAAAGLEALLAEGDAAFDQAHEPVASTFLDEGPGVAPAR